jgi:tape measure domain-containing protein
MPAVDPVIFEFRAEIAKFNADVARAQRLTDQRIGAIERRSISMGQSVNKGLSLAASSVLALAGSIATIQGAGALLAIADEAKQLDAQLRLATATFGSFAQAQEDVRRISAATRSGLSETATLYGNFTRNARELGITQEQAARATETVTQAFKISGATTAEASGGIRQLVQALQSGVLRGDEFNTVMESAPRLARLLADSLEVPIGSLRAMAEEGDLTANKLVRALTDTKFTDGIDAEFRELPVTFEQAMSQIENAAIITFGAFDRGGQFSTMLANFIIGGVDGFKDIEQAALDMGITVRGQLAGLVAAFQPLIDAARTAAGWMAQLNVNSEASGSKSFIRGTQDDIYRWAPNSLLGRAAKRAIDADDASQRLSRAQIGEQNLQEMLRGYDVLGRPIERAPVSAPAAGGGKKSKARKGPSAETLANRAAAEARRAENERLRDIRDEAANARDAARLDDEILAAKAALAVAADDILSFQLQAIERERQQRVADLETDVKLGDLTREEADKRILINSELAQLHGDLARRRADEAKAALAAASRRDEIDTLRAEAQLIETRGKRRDAEKRILDLAYQEEEFAIRRAHASGQIADLEEALANLRRRQLAETAMLERDHESPFESWSRRLSSESFEDRAEKLVIEQFESVRRGIASGLAQKLGVGDDPFITGLIELLLDEILFRPIAEALRKGREGGGGGILGGIIGAIGGLFGGKGRASGGYVQGGRLYRVNEGSSPGRVEGFIPQGSGTIVPLGRMNAAIGGGGSTQPAIVQVQVVSGEMFDVRVQRISGDVSAQVVRAAAPELIDLSAKETFRRSSRPSL